MNELCGDGVILLKEMELRLRDGSLNLFDKRGRVECRARVPCSHQQTCSTSAGADVPTGFSTSTDVRTSTGTSQHSCHH